MISTLQRDRKEEEKVDARRRRNRLYRERLLNEKNRLFGVDSDSIERQKAEKKIQKENEKLRDQFFDEQMNSIAKMGQIKHQRNQNMKRANLRNMQEYRKNYQQAHQRREWDLNDPLALRKEKFLPTKVMHGEDVRFKERKRQQQNQMRQWVEEKRAEEEEILREKMRKEQEYEKNLEKMNEYAVDLSSEQQRMKLEKLREIQEFNRSQAEMKRRKAKMQAEQERLEAETHMQTCRESPFYSEHYNSTLSHSKYSRDEDLSKRYQRGSFKGYDRQTYQNIENTRRRQIEEKRELDKRKKMEEEAQAAQQRRNFRLASLYQREMERKKQEQRRILLETHKMQQENAIKRKRHLDKVYEGKVTEDFFGQFGKDSR